MNPPEPEPPGPDRDGSDRRRGGKAERGAASIWRRAEGTKTRRDLRGGGRGRRGRGTGDVLLVGGEEEEGGEEHPADERDEAHGRGRASPPPPEERLALCVSGRWRVFGTGRQPEEARKEGETADWVGSKDGLLFCPESGWLAGGLVE